MTYAEAKEIMSTARNPEASKKIGNNTRLEATGSDAYGIRLHDTIVVEIHADGGYRLDSGGWQTVTTKERMNRYLPRGLKVWSVRRQWGVYHMGVKIADFEDGMTVKLTPAQAVAA